MLIRSVWSNSQCRDTDKEPCVGDRDSASLLAEVLDAEKPDLVVFSGDQLNGQVCSLPVTLPPPHRLTHAGCSLSSGNRQARGIP